MIKRLFVIYTPFQLISALNIMDTHNFHDADFLLVHPNMEKYKIICENSTSGKVSAESSLYDKDSNLPESIIRILILKDIINKKRYLKGPNTVIAKYDELFIPSDATTCRVIYHYLIKINKNTKLILYDDGTATYTNLRDRKKRILSRIIYTLVLESAFYKAVEMIYCYHPELVEGKNTVLMKIDFSDNIRQMFIKFAGKAIDIYRNKKVIFMDQGKNYKEILMCLNYLEQIIGKNDIIVKKHPRIKGAVDYSPYLCSDDGLPSETIFAALDCRNSLIVSYCSTSCITPYLLEGQRPYVVLLCKICNYNKVNIDPTVQLCNRINKTIGEDYIFIPDNYYKFTKYIDKISREISRIK